MLQSAERSFQIERFEVHRAQHGLELHLKLPSEKCQLGFRKIDRVVFRNGQFCRDEVENLVSPVVEERASRRRSK